jgi:hypothetical protein
MAGSLAAHPVHGVAGAKVVRFRTPAKVTSIPHDPPNPDAEIGRSPGTEVICGAFESRLFRGRLGGRRAGAIYHGPRRDGRAGAYRGPVSR